MIRNYTVACKISLLQDIVIHRMNLGLKLITWIRALFDILNLRENILNVSVTIGCEKSGCRLKDMLLKRTHTHSIVVFSQDESWFVGICFFKKLRKAQS